jgi:hydroxyacylglutathione hydrolase
MKLVDNLYTYIWQGNDNNCNSHVFAGALQGKKHLLVDPGHIVTPFYREAGLETLIAAMKQDGLNVADVGLVVLTHAHPDHAEGTLELKERYGTLVALHRADEPIYRSFGGKADLYLEEGVLALAVGDPGLTVIHTPGHSPGHISLYSPGSKALIAGDVIFYRSCGRYDFPGGSGRILRQSIQCLAALDTEYLLCGHPYGHPGLIKGRAAIKANFDYVLTNILP